MFKKIWNDPVWSKVISAAIITIVGLALTSLLMWWSAIDSYWAQAIALATRPTTIKNWLLGLLVLLALPTVLLGLILLWQMMRPPQLAKPDWRTDLSDEFFGLRWRWGYYGNEMFNVHTFCPHCDFQVYPNRASAFIAVDRITFQCENCNRELCTFEESYESLESRALRSAQQKIRTDTWNNSSST